MNAEQVLPAAIVNALTIDVEEYFQTPAYLDHYPRSTWDAAPCRTEASVEAILSALAEHEARATFFVLGWIAERFPDTVRRIVANGHELASYGYDRTRADAQGYGQFLAEIRLAKAVLEDIAGVQVKGYRAPEFSIGALNTSAYDCIVEAGYEYSSSVNPIRRRQRPKDFVERFAYPVRPGLVEVPVATVRALGTNWQVGGGDAFRRLPYPLARWLLRRVSASGACPATFHLRAWELDPENSHVGNEAEAPETILAGHPPPSLWIRRLLVDFRWESIDRLFGPEDAVVENL